MTKIYIKSKCKPQEVGRGKKFILDKIEFDKLLQEKERSNAY